MLDETGTELTGTFSRRRFLVTGGGTALLWLLGTSAAMAWVRPTVPNILGPYHRKGAPYRTKLNTANEPGKPLIIKGLVTDTNGKPVAGAVVDVWQADDGGHYDNDDAAHPPSANTFKLRGQMKTDASGRYEFETIVPGQYDMEPGVKRPSHIHYIVTQPGFVPLTTQLYFKADPHLAADPFVRPSLIIDLAKRPANAQFPKGHQSGTFNIVLQRPAN
ncbi:MAG: carboxypeptidase regulatory-like domain-containing protein [Candidatus Sericytochromatia bacterium]|nr:carboxypeptidase regulatory-like domain-containing protein [Candidatus Sericytochromatia bacterium]